jgi:hypothetical protein
MRSRILVVLSCACAIGLAQDQFSLGTINVPAPSSGSPSVEINTSGPPLSNAVLNDPANWQVFVSDNVKSAIPLLNFTPLWNAATGKVKITFDPAPLAGHDPRTFAWSIYFKGVVPNLTASRDKPKPPSSSLLGAAKGKDDADLYLFGSYLAGVSTKPIYVIDAKLNWIVAIRKGKPDPVTGKRIETGWSAGVTSALSSTTDTKAPVSRSKVDPDSITAALSLHYLWTPKRPPIDPSNPDMGAASGSHAVSSIDFQLLPVGGEFSRKYPASDFLTKGYVTLNLAPGKIHENWWVFLYPSVGYEIGKNLNQPGIIDKQPVNLSGWNGIYRAVFITKGGLYALKAKPKDGDVYRFTLDALYQPRIPFAAEPFVDSEYVAGKLASVTSMRKNTRHEVELGVNWNFSQFVALRLQYKYGALPPLFEFVDHQVTVGLTLKAKHNQ